MTPLIYLISWKWQNDYSTSLLTHFFRHKVDRQRVYIISWTPVMMPKHTPKVPKHFWNKVKLQDFHSHFHHIWSSYMMITYDDNIQSGAWGTGAYRLGAWGTRAYKWGAWASLPSPSDLRRPVLWIIIAQTTYYASGNGSFLIKICRLCTNTQQENKIKYYAAEKKKNEKRFWANMEMIWNNSSKTHFLFVAEHVL